LAFPLIAEETTTNPRRARRGRRFGLRRPICRAFGALSRAPRDSRKTLNVIENQDVYGEGQGSRATDVYPGLEKTEVGMIPALGQDWHFARAAATFSGRGAIGCGETLDRLGWTPPR